LQDSADLVRSTGSDNALRMLLCLESLMRQFLD
jgi:hypothetical protein